MSGRRALDLIVRGAREVFTATPSGPLDGAVVGVRGGTIAYLGAEAGLGAAGLEIGAATRVLDAADMLVTPGLVDPHTHLVFAGDRAEEYGRRAAGVPYLQIAAEGGGIAATMRATRAAPLEALVERARPRLDALLRCGVTTAEVKSGYGLTLEAEVKMLRAVEALDAAHPIDLVGTFLGAHTVPPERRPDRAAHVADIVERWIPAVAEHGLATFCDVFVETGAFTIPEGEAVLRAGLAHGLRPKVHADQLSPGGGAELAARVGAVSADHLEHISDAGIAALAEAGTVAVLLPGAALFLGVDDRAPARRLIEGGVRVALSTDCNPGTCMTENLLLMLTLGMSRLGLSAREALEAVTVHAAAALGRDDVAGTLQLGRPADLAIFATPSHHHLPYHFGGDPTRWVIKGGRVVYGD